MAMTAMIIYVQGLNVTFTLLVLTFHEKKQLQFMARSRSPLQIEAFLRHYAAYSGLIR